MYDLPPEIVPEADRDIAEWKSSIACRRLLGEGMTDAHHVVDLGSGFGELANELVADGKIVYGIDNDGYMIQYARRKLDRASMFIPLRADVQSIPLKEGSIDGVVCLGNLNEFQDHVQAIKEARRILRQGGYFAVVGTEYEKLDIFARLNGMEILRKRMGMSESVFSIAWEAFGLQEQALEVLMKSKRFRENQAYVRQVLEETGFRIEKATLFYEGSMYYLLATKQ